MKAYVHMGKPGLDYTFLTNIEEIEPQENEVRVRLKTAGLNHRDIWNLHRRNENLPPVVLGSDGAGVIESIGKGVTHLQLGDEVIINPSLGWPEKSASPPENFEIVGVPSNGTFAEYITIPAENVEPKPSHLTWEEAGVLSLAALTAYRALFTRGNLQRGQTVLIPGIGSGVAIFNMLMAKAVGARVIVSSRSQEKCEKAMELGADLAILSDIDWDRELKDEKIDLIIDSVGPALWEKELSVLRIGGTLVNFGATTGDHVTINLRNLYFGQYNILGTTMGSTEEYREMLNLIKRHQIRPVIDKVFQLDEAKEAFNRMNEGSQFGKICLKMEC